MMKAGVRESDVVVLSAPVGGPRCAGPFMLYPTPYQNSLYSPPALFIAPAASCPVRADALLTR